MTIPSTLEIDVLRSAYSAFNSRNIDSALALMTLDVQWPKAFKGGYASEPDEVRAYWTEQWGEIDPTVEPVDFHLEDSGSILVTVHQVVRSLDGVVLADDQVRHRFVLVDGLIRSMEVDSAAVDLGE